MDLMIIFEWTLFHPSTCKTLTHTFFMNFTLQDILDYEKYGHYELHIAIDYEKYGLYELHIAIDC